MQLPQRLIQDARRSIPLAAFAGASLILVGCAGNPPTEDMTRAELAVQQTQSSGSEQLAPVETTQAREKYQSAQKAMADKDYEYAAYMAQQAMVDAQLAMVKARSERARKSVMELQKSINDLKQQVGQHIQMQQQELQQMQQPQQPGQ